MLFRWLFDELKNALWSFTYKMLTAIAAIVGVWLVLALIYFVLTY